MRKNQIKGMINDLLELSSWEHPLTHFSEIDEVKVDLLSGEVFYPDEDNVWKFYKGKAEWFRKRIKELKSESEFQKAILIVNNHKERVEITFKNENFSGEKQFGSAVLPEQILKAQSLRNAIKELKPSANVSNWKNKNGK
ncbi:MAG: hypothetical protein WCI72_03115 [archaeon]